MAMGSRTSGFSGVDHTSVPAEYVRRLDAMAATDFWQTVKRRTYALLDLQTGDRVLDVGCGTGEDVRAVAPRVGATGCVVGIDSSATMVMEARRRAEGSGLPVAFWRGDARHLPFADRCFDGCRTERLLQHLDVPERALAEMVRVTRSGGRLVAVEPDYGTLAVKGADAALTSRILASRCAHFRSGRIGRELPPLCQQLGLREVRLVLFTQRSAQLDASVRRQLRKYVDGAVADGTATVTEGEDWLTMLEAASAGGGFRHSVSVFLVSGRRP